MFFVPYSCDAPIYHLPIATGGLIVANVAVFVGLVSGSLQPSDGWVLEYAAGLHPEQWVMAMFAHDGLGHLLGNMFFLWVFGLVVEGKIGWWKFLVVYLGIGVTQSAAEQLIFLNSSYGGQGSLGASAAVYGLMAVACVWAPLNEVKMFGSIFLVYVFSFEVPIQGLAAFYVGIELLTTFVFGHLAGGATLGGSLFATQVLPALLHLSGALLGAVVGVVMVKRNMVDCENWDIFAVMRGEEGKKSETLALSDEEQLTLGDRRRLETLRKLQAYLAIGKPREALEQLRRLEHQGQSADLSRDQWLKLILGLHQEKLWKDSAPLMQRFLEHFPAGSDSVRLRLAQICLVELERPAKTLELLADIKSSELGEKQLALYRKLKGVAQKQIAEGAVELDDAF